MMERKKHSVFDKFIVFLLVFCAIAGISAGAGGEIHTVEAADASCLNSGYTGLKKTATAHTYNSVHVCSDTCKELLHTHETIWDEKEYEYICNGTETYIMRSFSGEITPLESVCGHGFSYSSTEYGCNLCGEYLYTVSRTGCMTSSCSNYYKNRDNYYNESHPGVHTYKRVGTRYTCTYSAGQKQEGYRDDNMISYSVTCATCGEELGDYYVGPVWKDGYELTLTQAYQSTSNHYFYVKEPVGGCYGYGEVHYAKTITEDPYYSYGNTCFCGGTYADSYIYYECKTCEASLYRTISEGHSACGNRQTYTVVDTDIIKWIGLYSYTASYRSYDETTNYRYSYHRLRTLTCTTATHGDKICDKVVTGLMPLEDLQQIKAGDSVNTQAYAKFLDGHMELVTCAVSDYDAARYNEWQTVTLSYGTYSSVSEKSPRTATIQVYIERVDFDVTATVEDSSMGSVTGTGSYMAGGEVTVSASPAEGYSFEGWYKDGTKVSIEKEYIFTMPNANVTLTAKFTEKWYNLNVSSENAAKGTVASSEEGNSLVKYNASVTVSAMAEDGFTFLGWYSGTQHVSTDSTYIFSMPAYDLNLVAKFGADAVVVSFDSAGGTPCPAIQVPYLESYGSLPVPEKNGYVFLGWKYNGTYITASSPVEQKEAHTLTAEWSEAGPEFILVQYGLIYGDNSWSADSSNIGTMGLTAGNLRYHLPVPAASGYSFVDWYLTENSLGNGDDLGDTSNIITKDTVVTIDKQHTIYTGWKEKEYTVSFEANGGTVPAPVIVVFHKNYGYITPLPFSEKSGYLFKGWYSSNLGGNGTGMLITNDSRVELLDDQTLYAGWEKISGIMEEISVGVTFSPLAAGQEGLTEEESISRGCGSTFGIIAAGEAERTITYPGTYGNYPMDWCDCTTASHSGAPSFGSRHYIITYDGTYTALPTAVRTGYTFTGWQYEGKNITESTETCVAFDHTAYAVYTPNKYHITLDGQGAGTQTQTGVTMIFDQMVPDVTVPVRTGYKFMGYYTETKGNGTKYYNAKGQGLKVWCDTNTTVLYACWKKMTGISYHANGGAGTMPTVWLEPGITSADVLHNEFVREGYAFSHWCTMQKCPGTFQQEHVDYSGGQTITGIRSDLVLYAQWVKQVKRIVYDGNGGSGYMPDTVVGKTVTSTYLSKNAYSRTGYVFRHWCTEKECPGAEKTGHQDYTEEAFVSDLEDILVLYAQWEEVKISYTLVYMKYPYANEENMVWKKKTLSYNELLLVEGAPYEVSGYSVSYDLNRTVSMSSVPEKLKLTEENTLTGEAEFKGWVLYESTGVGYENTEYCFTKGQEVSRLTNQDRAVLYLFPAWEEDGSSVKLPEAFCEGYEFVGWSETKGAGGKIYTYIPESASGAGEEEGINRFFPVQNTILYAVWKPVLDEVILDDRGATGTGHTERVFMTRDEKGPDIVVPEKRGYRFQGYYTECRGFGVQYYDASGECIKAWTAEAGKILYAYWVQEEVELPVEVEQIIPTPLPQLVAEGMLKARREQALLYADDYNAATGALTDLQPYLAYDTPASAGAIPGTEQLAFRARLGAWLLDYRFCRYSGLEEVRVLVTVSYRTQVEQENEELIISGPQTKTYAFMIPKAWSYWGVEKCGVYYPKQVTVKNEAFLESEIVVDVVPKEEEQTPDYGVLVYGGKENHVFWPGYGADGVPEIELVLKEEQYIISTEPGVFPDVDQYLQVVCGNAARADNFQAKVRSDRLTLEGRTVLSDEVQENGIGCALEEDLLKSLEDEIPYIGYEQLYHDGIELDRFKPNGSYATKASVVLVGDMANVGAVLTEEGVLAGVNSINVHTPVACDGKILLEGEGDVLALKDSRCYFAVEISNAGIHNKKLGYGARNFRTALSGVYNIAEENGMLLNQVRFSCDVMMDVRNDTKLLHSSEDDILVEKEKWITIGPKMQQFYFTSELWPEEAEAEFRTIAVNCPKSMDGAYQVSGREQNFVNTDWTKYVATDHQSLVLEGKPDDFVIVDTDDTEARKVLQQGNQALTLKKGYGFTWTLLSKSQEMKQGKISCIPSFFWVSADGNQREEVICYGSVLVQSTEIELQCIADDGETLSWQGTFQIPVNVRCVSLEQVPEFEAYAAVQTITGKEPFFKRDGFLVVHFVITGETEEGVPYVFSGWENTKLAADALAAGWNYVPGDIIRYDLSKSISDDYEVGGVE